MYGNRCYYSGIKFTFFFKCYFWNLMTCISRKHFLTDDHTLFACEQAHVRLETKSARGSRETRKWPDPRGSGAWLEREPALGLILLILITSLLSTLLQTSTRSFWQQSGHCTTKIAYFSVPDEYIRRSAEHFDAQMKCFVFLSSVIVLHTRPLVRLNF